MAKHKLYTVFHLNLAFSSIPKEDYSTVIERCYYPILELAEHGIALGVEASGDTLREIAGIDSGFIRRLAMLNKEARIEFVGSGLSQIVMPLAPHTINRWNLELGSKVYKDFFGSAPRLALVNEQSFSSALVDIYREAGYETILMDFSNPHLYNRYPKQYLYYPQKARGLDTDINLLWSHSISFQKFQRYAYGDLSLEQYMDFISAHLFADETSTGAPRSFPLYINDAEVFSYRPGAGRCGATHGEWERISALLSHLDSTDGLEVVLPSEVVESTLDAGNDDSFNSLVLTSAQSPIPCKKQKKYNPTRWAVTGRDSVHINTECFRALKTLEGLAGTLDAEEFDKYREKLCFLWGSDFRTNTSDEKLDDFKNLMGWLKVELSARQVKAPKPLKDKTSLCAGVSRPARVESNEKELIIDAGETTAIFLKAKGLAIKGLSMPGLSPLPIIRTLEHGFFDDIHFGADFFSGHLINVKRGSSAETDLIPTEAEIVDNAQALRLSCQINLDFGTLTKIYDIYKREPRLDLTYQLKVSALNAASLRLGIFTLNPLAFDMGSLWFETCNGGERPERFALSNAVVNHGEPVSPTVSATTCLGATSGAVTLGDRDRAVCISSDRAELYSVPMIHFSPVDGKYFYRVSHSIGETDETAYWTWRGLNTISFTIKPV